MRVLGALLAGGRSSRFGSDKALAPHRDRALIEHGWAALGSVADATVVCGRGYFDWPWIADRPAGGLGPLGGLCAALDHARRHGFDRVVSIGCDTPSVPPDLLALLVGAPGPTYLDDAPIVGGWPAALAPALDTFIATDAIRSVRGWANAVGAEPIDGWSIANVNRPGDLAALRTGQ